MATASLAVVIPTKLATISCSALFNAFKDTPREGVAAVGATTVVVSQKLLPAPLPTVAPTLGGVRRPPAPAAAAAAARTNGLVFASNG